MGSRGGGKEKGREVNKEGGETKKKRRREGGKQGDLKEGRKEGGEIRLQER